MAKHHINRVFTETFNTSTGKCDTSIKLEVPVEVIQKGFIGKIGGANHLAVLLTILSFSNTKGESYPTQEKIAKIVGLSRQTVSKIIADLLEVKIEGSHLISKEKNKTGEYSNNVYTYMVPMVPDDFEGRLFKNCNDVISYFCDVFGDTYGNSYMPMWKRDAQLIKDKLYNKFTDDQIKGMIDVAVKEYATRWYKPQFPRPNISILCGWLGNAALQIYEAEKVKQIEQTARMERDTAKEFDVASQYI